MKSNQKQQQRVNFNERRTKGLFVRVKPDVEDKFMGMLCRTDLNKGEFLEKLIIGAAKLSKSDFLKLIKC